MGMGILLAFEMQFHLEPPAVVLMVAQVVLVVDGVASAAARAGEDEAGVAALAEVSAT